MLCRQRVPARPVAELPRPRVFAKQGRSSERSSTSRVRRNAREVCVARWYDPSTGEFMSVDPDLAETDQPYTYAGADPVNAVDRSGMSTHGYCDELSASVNFNPLLPIIAPVPGFNPGINIYADSMECIMEDTSGNVGLVTEGERHYGINLESATSSGGCPENPANVGNSVLTSSFTDTLLHDWETISQSIVSVNRNLLDVNTDAPTLSDLKGVWISHGLNIQYGASLGIVGIGAGFEAASIRSAAGEGQGDVYGLTSSLSWGGVPHVDITAGAVSNLTFTGYEPITFSSNPIGYDGARAIIDFGDAAIGKAAYIGTQPPSPPMVV